MGDHVADSKYISLTRASILRMENAQPLNDLRGAMGAAGKHQWIEFWPINNSTPLIVARLSSSTCILLTSFVNKCNIHGEEMQIAAQSTGLKMQIEWSNTAKIHELSIPLKFHI